MKVLIIGSGGREHTLAWVSARSPLNPDISCIPGNGGTDLIARNIEIETSNLGKIADYICEQQFDLTIIGPEAPLVAGLTDKLTKYGLPVFGPSSGAAKIEGSKAFAKSIMTEMSVPTAKFAIFKDISQATKYIRSKRAPIVIKTSGLAAGKGAIICRSMVEAVKTAQNMLSGDAFGEAGKEIVVEEFLSGREMSLMAFVDGEDYLLLPSARDYKRAFEEDQGPNTGGMGAYAPVDDMADDQIEVIADMIFPPILKKLSDWGTPYRGLLYPGLILTEDGPKVLEFNCRFGDPEAQVVLPLLKVDPLEIMIQVANGNLKNWMSSHHLNNNGWRRISTTISAVTVITAMEGYPGSYRKGVKISSVPQETDHVIPFHAGTINRDGELFTSGGRVLAITGIGKDHNEAVETAYTAIEQVHFDGMRYRRDIGR